MTSKPIKITKIDRQFSILVRERTAWTCERCSKVFPEGYRQGLHCSHLVVGRRARATRWHSWNAAAHCHGCHAFLAANPFVFTDWCVEHLGVEKVDLLRRLGNSILRLRKLNVEEAYKHFQNEHDRMLRMRIDGVGGRIPFEDAPVIREHHNYIEELVRQDG